MDTNGFGALNWLVLIVYLAAMLGLGVYFSKSGGKDTHAFFKAGGHIPGWAAGLSVYATTLSAITFMSIPERAFLTDWTYAASNITIIILVPVLLMFYIPFFRKLDVTTAYEYLEARFGVSLRLFGSIMFVLFHIGRIAIVYIFADVGHYICFIDESLFNCCMYRTFVYRIHLFGRDEGCDLERCYSGYRTLGRCFTDNFLWCL